jgi:malto-oligosyltrehalose trehalohydrolase
MTAFARRLPFGAELIGEDRTRFRLWAPSRQAVAVEIENQKASPMRAEGEGWFAVEAACGAGARYRYRFDDQLAAPDPAARAQGPDVHDPSVVIDPRAYAWRTPDWLGRPWEEAVIYEAHAGLLGGFKGVAERLPDLADLGVTAVELMPIADFSGRRNWGYDGVLAYAPDAAYGSPDDLKALIDRAHDLGLMMVLDVVYNHFGPDGNYLPAYAQEFFRDDLHTPWGGAIDFRRSEVRRFFTENAIYWVEEYRFDGLRFDAVHAIGDPAWLDETAAAVRSAVTPGRHVHLILENEQNSAARLAGPFDAQWNDDFHNVMHVLLTGETGAYYQDFADRPAERLARCLAEGFVYQGEPSANHDGERRGEPSGGLPTTAFVSFLQNHDQTGNRGLGERLTALADPDALKAAAALMLLGPQIPLLFMGEEVGSRTPFLFFTDFHDALADAVREGRRKEFAKFPAFSDPQARRRIPDPNARDTFEQSRPAPGPDAGVWRAFYKDLLTLRRTQIVPRLKGTRAMEAAAVGEKAVFAAWRMGDGARLSLAVNLDGATVPFDRSPHAQPLYSHGEILPGALSRYSAIAWLETGL